MKNLLEDHGNDIALVIGNGVNQFLRGTHRNSWDELLAELAQVRLGPTYTARLPGVSLTELYDVLDLQSRSSQAGTTLQAEFCEQMSSWEHLPQHESITAWAKRKSVPVLTTNFDSTLSQAAQLYKLKHLGKSKFTAYYPWSSYFGSENLRDPLSDFAIWHINGMLCYRQSIRLGLSHYMGSVERARRWLHKSGSRLFGASDTKSWPGAATWLQVFMHKPLLIFGLGLGENEVFLRWLLIERAKYFRKFPERAKGGWYAFVDGSNDLNAGKAFFLNGVGIKPFVVASFDNIYDASVWA